MKIVMLGKAWLLYDELVNSYKKEYGQAFEIKDNAGSKNMITKIFKDLNHQPD